MFVVTISGLSCSGKTYVAECLPDLVFSSLVSTTTRPQRRNEIPGFDYHFLAADIFDKYLFIERDSFAGYSYGLTDSEFDRVLKMGGVPVHVCTPSGAHAMRQYCSKIELSCLSIFIEVPLQLAFFRMLKRWMRDKSFSVSYLADRITALVTVESQWDQKFHIFSQGGSDSFDPLIADIVSIVNGDKSLPPLHVRKPSCRIDAPLNIQGLLDHVGRPRTPDDCESIATLICDHLSINSYEAV